MPNRADLSQFLIHLTKNGTFQVYTPHVASGGYQRSAQTVVAKDSLEQILQAMKIEARSPFGYFKLKINHMWWNNGGVDPSSIKTVCFSEAPLSEIDSFYQATTSKRNQYQKYGIAFWQERVRAKGGNPIFYVDSRRADLKTALNGMLTLIPTFNPLFHLVDTFGPLVLTGTGMSDFRWEREWRKLGDLDFIYTDVAFGICPDNEIAHFEGLANNRIVFIDPDWTEPNLKAYLRTKAPALLAHF